MPRLTAHSKIITVSVLALVAVSCQTLPPTLDSSALKPPQSERMTLNCRRNDADSPLIVLWTHTPETSSLTGVDSLGITRFRATLVATKQTVTGSASAAETRELFAFYQLLHWPPASWRSALEKSGWLFIWQNNTATLRRRNAVWRAAESDGKVEFTRTSGAQTLVSCAGEIFPQRP